VCFRGPGFLAEMVLVRDDGCEILTLREGEKDLEGAPLQRLQIADGR